nr:RecName: Full=Preblooming protein 1; Short=PB1 [Prorocentrum triestinum]P83766.1 RecName: Full=Preblooming protein 3; Short=PB3 [Prorocentrum triestinum]
AEYDVSDADIEAFYQ